MKNKHFAPSKDYNGAWQQYGKARLEAACHRANAFGMVGLRRVRAILATQLDNEALPEPPPQPNVVEHANLRGPQYYR